MPSKKASDFPYVPAIRKAQKRAAVKRVLAANKPATADKLLHWFGKGWLRSEGFSPTVEEVFVGCFEGAGKELDVAAKATVKNGFGAARRWLRDFNLRPDSLGQIRLELPLPVPQGPHPGNYSMAFKHPDRPHLPGSAAAADLTVLMWQQMVHALPIRDILLIYDTPRVGLIHKAREAESAWSGSGEVAAACLLGEQLARLQPPIKVAVRRWRDMTRAELEEPSRCLIILGSALGVPLMEHLCEREKWSELQKFRFVPAERGSRHNHICRIEPQSKMNENREMFSYQNDNATNSGARTREMDWALVSFFRDTDNLQTLIGLQGITTAGTLGAARFLCDMKGVRALRDGLGLPPGTKDAKRPLSFELLLKVEVETDRFPGKVSISRLDPYEESPIEKAV